MDSANDKQKTNGDARDPCVVVCHNGREVRYPDFQMVTDENAARNLGAFRRKNGAQLTWS